MMVMGINTGALRYFGWLLLLAAGLFGMEAIVGSVWSGVAPFELRSMLAGWAMVIAAAGILSATAHRVGTRLPRWHRWIFGLGLGVLLPLKLGFTHVGSLMVTGALTALVVVLISRTQSRGSVRVLPLIFLLLFVLGSGWTGGRQASAVGELTRGVLAAGVLAGLFVVLYRDPADLGDFLAGRPRMVTGVVLVVFAGGLTLWSTVETREEDPSYFSGTVPEVHGPEGTSLRDMPNIILISVDTLRVDRVPPLSDEELRVPNLRDLKEDSVRLTKVFSSSSWTLPSHASLFTGLPPMAHGAVNPERSRIYANVPSYVQMLKNVGYQTAAFTDGGFVSNQLGFGRGFERYQSSYATGEIRSNTFEPGIQPLGRRLLDAIASSRPDHPPGTEPREYNYFWQNLRAARGWLSSERKSRRPFFLFLHTYQAHDYFALYPRSINRLQEQHPKLARAASSMGGLGWGFHSLDAAQKQRLHRRLKTVESSSVRSSLSSLASVHPPVWNVMKSWVLGQSDRQWKAFLELSVKNQKNVLYRVSRGARRWGVPVIPNLHTDYGRTPYSEWLRSTFNLKPETVRAIKAGNRQKMEGLEWLYDDLVEDVVRALGGFLDYLRSRGLYDDTLVVFLSDHGEGFSWSPQVVGHGFRDLGDGRGQLHDALIHVPVWIKPPAAAPSEGLCEELYQLRDIFPIILRELDVRFPDAAPGDELVRAEEGSRFCPRSRRTLAKGSVSQRKPWLEFLPRFYVRGEGYRLEVQRDPVELSSFWELRDGEPDRRMPADAVPEGTRKRLREELEAELRGLGYF